MTEAPVNQCWIVTDPQGRHCVVEIAATPAMALKFYELFARDGGRVEVVSPARCYRILERLEAVDA